MLNTLDVRKLYCPYCGETIELVIDCSVSEQSYIEDCQVCCRPINLSITVDQDGGAEVRATSDDE